MTPRLPLYQALADSLIQSLQAGRYRPGDRLPSVRDLCRAHGMSLATVTHALHRLEDAGWISSRSRQGFFVKEARDGRSHAKVPAASALDLEERRQRLMALATAREGQISLSHLGLSPALLPLTPLRRAASRRLRIEADVLASGTVFGSQALREQLAQRMERAGVAVHADDVILTHGDGESLQLILGLLTTPGDRIAVASPGSLRMLEVVAALGLQAVELAASPGSGGLVAAVEALLAREKPAACVIDICLFSAAAGPMSDTDKQSLVALLATHQVPLVEFDLMGELHRGAQRSRPLKSFDRDDRVIHCGNLACVTGPGFSVGFVVSGRYRLRLRAARSVHGELILQMTDHVLADFLAGTDFDTHLRRLRSSLAQQVAAWTHAVRRCFPAGTRVSTGDAGYVLWVELPAPLVAEDLLEQMQADGYSFVPGAVFSLEGSFDHCLRLTAAHPLDEVRTRGLRLLGAAAHQALGCALPSQA